MTTRTAARPAQADFDPFYAGYVSLVPDGDIVETLRVQREDLAALFARVPEERHGFRYSPGKWTLEEVVGHVVDIERVFSYRAMCFARGLAEVEQPGVDQDLMVPASGATERGLDSLAREFDHLRLANIELFHTFDDEQLAVLGRASGLPLTTRAMLYILHGHAEHHARFIEDRYL